MTRKQRDKADPLEHEIQSALSPGAFIPDGACFSFVSDLDEVAAGIGRIAETDPARAIALYETFLAGCHEKAEEIDDSSGSFGQFVGEIFCGWIKARRAGHTDPGETATRLLAWMDDDPYGFCHGLEKDAAKAFDKAGLAAFEKQVRARFDAAAPATDGSFRDRDEYRRRRWGEALRTVYREQKNVGAYISLAEATGLTAEDCHAVAALLVTRRKPEEALGWIERGIVLDKKAQYGSSAGHGLAKLKREVLTKLGRGHEAFEAAWADFRKHPSKYSYDDLMKFVPKTERSGWHEKAIEAAAKGTDLHSLIELLLETKELEQLAEIVRQSTDAALERVSHYATERGAKKLEKSHPDLAARLWRAQAMRIIDMKKSKYYGAALSNFERAKRCYEKAGLTAEWEKTVSEVRAEHHRKHGLMSGFEDLVAGSGPSARPSFLERAKARWGRGRETT